MPLVNLKVSLGTVNYTDWIHVTASKVSAPTVNVWQEWYDAPLLNFHFIIPDLDPENYYIRYYDSPDNVSLGTLVAEILVNALTGEWIWERRFYTCGAGGVGDPPLGGTTITDPYFQGKTIYACFKEAFRYLEPVTEWAYTDSIFQIAVLNGTQFFPGEKFIVELKYNVGNSSGSGPVNGLYRTTLTILDQVRTLMANEADTRIRLKGTAATQTITLPSLAAVSMDRGFYFDHSVKRFAGGCPLQTKILCDGLDAIQYNGFCSKFGLDTNLFGEFWVSNGEHLLIRKTHDDEDGKDYWEVINDYQGTIVGQKRSVMYKAHPNTIPWDGGLYDGNEYPRFWWWLINILPGTQKYTTTESNLINGGWYDINKAGMFCYSPTLKKFRSPIVYNMAERALIGFNGEADAFRGNNYAGGHQNWMVGPHPHLFHRGRGGSINSDPDGGAVIVNTVNPITEAGWVLNNSNSHENTVENYGVIICSHI